MILRANRKCGAAYIELGRRPEDDRLMRCTADPCPHHHVELEWVRRSPARLAAYNEQLRRLDLGEQVAAGAEAEAKRLEAAKAKAEQETQAEQETML